MKRYKLVKKSLLFLGTLSAIVAPIGAVIACGSSSSNEEVAKPNGSSTQNGPKTGNTDNTKNTDNIGNKDKPWDGKPDVIPGPGTITTKTVAAADDAAATGYSDLKYGSFTPHGFVGDPNHVTTSSDPKVLDDKLHMDSGNRNDPENGKAGPIFKSELMDRSVNGTPYSGHFFIEDLTKGWVPGKDADDAFLRATVPLQTRTLGTKIIDSQDENYLQPFATTSLHTSDTRLGSPESTYGNYNMLGDWSHMDSVVAWGGAGDEGDIIFPKASQVNAAHKNGVAMLGNIFIDHSVNSPYERLSKQNPDGSYPAVDSLVKLATYYGFDGWFFNFENDRDVLEVPQLFHFMASLYQKMHAVNKIVEIYDFNQGNRFMGGVVGDPFDYAAMDENGGNPASRDPKPDYFKNTPEDKRLSGYNVGDHGLSYDEWTNNGNGGVLDSEHNNWIYAYQDLKGFDQGDDNKRLGFYNGWQNSSLKTGLRDPRLSTGAGWNGLTLSHQEHTTFNSRRTFATSFDLGKNLSPDYLIGGVKHEIVKTPSATTGGYLNPGLQDALPSYTWINDQYNSATDFSQTNLVDMMNIPNEKLMEGTFTVNDGTKDVPWISTLDHSKAYNGDGTLHYTGAIGSGKSIVNKLYASKVELKENDTFTVVSDSADTKLAIWTQDTYNPSVVQTLVSKVLVPEANPEQKANGFYELKYKIPTDLVGKTMTSFGLAFSNITSAPVDVDYHVGFIGFKPVDEAKQEDNYLTSLTQDGTWGKVGSQVNVRVNWTMQNAQNVDHYVIWRTKDNGGTEKTTIQTLTALPAAYLENVGDENELHYIIDAVGEDESVLSSNKVTIKVR